MDSSVTELLWGLHWLPIKARVQYNILLFVYEALNTSIPPYLAALPTRKSFCKVTRTSQKVNILNVPAHGKGRHSIKSFSVVVPTMWNKLLTNDLRECTSIDVFKKRLKTHLSIFTINNYSLFFLSHNFYFVIVDMYIFIVIVFR